MKKLISEGVNVNFRYDDGETPLSIATKLGNTEIAEILAQNGADVNAENDQGFSPLFIAAKEGNVLIPFELNVEIHSEYLIPIFE